MMLTTKGRYAVMAITDMIYYHSDEKPVKLQYIAERQNIPLNYLEQIFSRLKKNNIVNAVKGPGGGYKLAKELDEIYVADIIKASEESIKMTRCNADKNGLGCMPNGAKCLTHDLWDRLGQQIEIYLSSVSLKQLQNQWDI